jgi:hypothetical protein
VRVRARLWPPAAAVLIPLILAGTVVYGVPDDTDDTMEAKIMPIALNPVALALLVVSQP